MATSHGYHGRDSARHVTDEQGEVMDEVTLVVAIDFGTYASGYAYQWSHDYMNDRNKIICNTKWPRCGHRTFKTTTVVLLRPDTSFHSFGAEAEDAYASLELNEQNPQEWYLFRFFKMALYDAQELSMTTPLHTDDGKSLSMLLVFSRAIEYMKNSFMAHLQEKGISFLGLETRWVLTVPAIWNDGAKQMMRTAAEMAGIRPDRLLLALEPECAAIACSQSSVGHFARAFTPGSTAMIVDMGGGTVDITTIQTLRNGGMKQVYMSGGGAWGGTNINKHFINLMKNIVGKPVWAEFAENHALDEFEFRADFENKKRDVLVDEESTETKKKLLIKLPSTLKEIWEKHTGRRVANELQNRVDLQTTVTFLGGRLGISMGCVLKFFDDTIKSILDYIHGSVKDPFHDTAGIGAVVLVGGVAESPYVVHRIRQSMSKLDIPVLIPESPECSVLRGATLFGHNPGVMTSRILTRSYGASMCQRYDPDEHTTEKAIVIDGIKYVKDVFSVHAARGQEVRLNEWLPCIEYTPVGKFKNDSKVFIYISEHKIPKYVTDKDCHLLGYLDFKFSSEFRTRSNTAEMGAGSEELIESGSIHESSEIRPAGTENMAKSERGNSESRVAHANISSTTESVEIRGKSDQSDDDKTGCQRSPERVAKTSNAYVDGRTKKGEDGIRRSEKVTKAVSVAMCFGGTELRVRATDVASQDTYCTSLRII